MIYNYFKVKKLSSRGGFSLVELIVAMSLFIVAVSIVSVIFIRTVQSQRQANMLMSINSDASLILERVIRDARTGFDFNLSDNNGTCPINQFDTLSFTSLRPGKEVSISYRWNESVNNLERSENGGSYEAMNSSTLSIDYLCFINTQSSLDHPPRITMTLGISPRDESINQMFRFQSSVSARILPAEAN